MLSSGSPLCAATLLQPIQPILPQQQPLCCRKGRIHTDNVPISVGFPAESCLFQGVPTGAGQSCAPCQLPCKPVLGLGLVVGLSHRWIGPGGSPAQPT